MTESEKFDRALYRVMRDESPLEDVSDLSTEELRMLQMAQTLRGAGSESSPSPEFAATLRRRIQEHKTTRISRRTAVVSGLGALAAGIAAGFGLDRGLGSQTATPEATPLVGRNGGWVRVAEAASLPEGAVKSFTAGAVRGFLVHRKGRIHAVSGVCTHMGCLLHHQAGRDELTCPCHGAEFSLEGRSLVYPGAANRKLPPLPKIGVRVRAGGIEVWAV